MHSEVLSGHHKLWQAGESFDVHFEGRELYDISDICGNNKNANAIANNKMYAGQPETPSKKPESQRDPH